MARQNSEFAVLESRLAVGGQLLTLQGLGGVYEDLPAAARRAPGRQRRPCARRRRGVLRGRCRASTRHRRRAGGFAAVSSPGRLERCVRRRASSSMPRTTRRATALANALAEEFDFRRLVGVIGVLGDKDAEGLLEALEPVLDHVVVTNNGSPRAPRTETLAEIARAVFGEDRVTVEPFLPDAVEAAIGLAEESEDSRLLVRVW